MTDIRTINTAGPIAFDFDWNMGFGTLESDDGLETAVIISLFSDRTAAADDILPDGMGDRRGFWGDVSLDGGPPDLIGSRLWLLSRAKATLKTAARAKQYTLEALQWLIDDGVAGAIAVVAEYVSREQLRLTVTITRQLAGQQVSHRYDFVWNPAQPIPLVPKTLLLGDGLGNVLGDGSGLDFAIF